MKYIAFILSFVIFSLSVVPCGDAMHIEDTQGECQTVVENEAHQHSEDEPDTCTPFCTCNCCGTTVPMPGTVNIDMNKSISEFSYLFHYAFHYNFDYSVGIWHPPLNV